MRNQLISAIFLFSSFSSHADDLDPPVWRGSKDTTFQEWDFLFEPSSSKRQLSGDCVVPLENETPWGNRGAPDKISNPFQGQNGICVEYRTMWTMSNKIDWLKDYNGRQGVWHLSIDSAAFNRIEFIIANKHSDMGASKEYQIQIDYEDSNLHPQVLILILIPGREQYTYLQADKEYQSGILPKGWVQRTFSFHSNFCPSYENIQIFSHTRGEIHIDKVVVDTICRDAVIEKKQLVY